jgi:CubicO group peptidase (beta-lactamase class C family)
MSSGVGWNEDYTDPNADVAVAPLGGVALFQYMNQLPRTDQPGAAFNYSTGETNLVGAMLRAAIGHNLSTYLAAKIWQPYGMESNANWLLDRRHGAEVGGCCISATLRDYARIGLFALNSGRLAGGQSALPDDWMRRSTAASPSFAGYGYSWWLMQPEVFAAEGVFGQIIWVDRRHNLVIAMHSAWPAAWGPELESELMAFIRAITARLVEA